MGGKLKEPKQPEQGQAGQDVRLPDELRQHGGQGGPQAQQGRAQDDGPAQVDTAHAQAVPDLHQDLLLQDHRQAHGLLPAVREGRL